MTRILNEREKAAAGTYSDKVLTQLVQDAYEGKVDFATVARFFFRAEYMRGDKIKLVLSTLERTDTDTGYFNVYPKPEISDYHKKVIASSVRASELEATMRRLQEKHKNAEGKVICLQCYREGKSVCTHGAAVPLPGESTPEYLERNPACPHCLRVHWPICDSE